MNPIDPSRRSVVAAAALGSLAFGAARTSRSETLAKPADRIGVAMVGLGGYARFAMPRLRHARWAYPAALVSGDPNKAKQWASEFGIPADAIYGYDEYDRLARDERVDAVHICLPVGLHARHAELAFRAGKHVLCEKTLATSVVEAQRMAATADRHRRLLMPAHRAWFSDAVQQVRRRIREGTHGPLVSIDAHKGFAMQLAAGNWRFDPALAGAGCLVDIGVYSLQLQRWFAGGTPRRVRAIVARPAGDPRFAAVESDVHWVAEFDGGVIATGSASWRYRLQNRVQVGCAAASLEIDPATPAIGERLRIGLDAPNRIEEPAVALVDQLPLMYDAFALACLGRETLPVTAQDGIDDLRFVESVLGAAQGVDGSDERDAAR